MSQPEASELPDLEINRIYHEERNKLGRHSPILFARACVLADRARQAVKPEASEIKTAWLNYLDGKELPLEDAFLFGAGFIAARQAAIAQPETMTVAEVWAAIDGQEGFAGNKADVLHTLSVLAKASDECEEGKCRAIAQPSGAVPDGYVLMPKNPSEAILQLDGWPRLEWARYQAMLAASPQPPASIKGK